ncbi:MAG: response regulator transcription factor [Deltaproteobacteria bacterium]|nr:MAG: response regulator transcription factor [Deltaproteobacteria bacterium]
MRARVLLADDHRAMLDTVGQLLGREFDIVGATTDGQAVLDAAAELEPDVVVLDISMPVLNGLGAAQRLKQMRSGAKIVFLTVQEDPDVARQALATGALGYVVKSSVVSELVFAIREALADRSFVSRSVLLEEPT